LHEWRPLAEQGDADAQYRLGVLYANGYGVPKDYVQARQWYEKAAAQGNTIAQYNLGRL
jgi:TPR repeat protein